MSFVAGTESVLPKLAISPQSTPRDIITATISTIIDWLGDHPNLYYFLRTLRNGSSLDVVENTLAVQVAALLKVLMLMFGIDDGQAEPGAHGLVGFVEATGAWWLNHQADIGRDRITEMICSGVWNLLQGTARAEGITIHYDQPLPIGPAR